MIKNGEFKGTVSESLKDLKSDVSDMQRDVKSLDKRVWIITLLVVIAILERLPNYMSVILAAVK